jgi:hypothetical protein
MSTRSKRRRRETAASKTRRSSFVAASKVHAGISVLQGVKYQASDVPTLKVKPMEHIDADTYKPTAAQMYHDVKSQVAADTQLRIAGDWGNAHHDYNTDTHIGVLVTPAKLARRPIIKLPRGGFDGKLRCVEGKQHATCKPLAG